MRHTLPMFLRTALPACLLAACASPDAEPVAIEPDWSPAAFTKDERHRAIRRSAPAIDAAFLELAEANHHVGHVWGVVTEDGLAYLGRYGFSDLEKREPADEHSRFHIASLTKSFTCMALLKLRDEGHLALTDPIEDWVPEFRAARRPTRDSQPVTVEHFMTMTSGLPEDNPWADRQLDDTREELLALIEDGLSLSTVPGSAYEYSNLGYAVLGVVVERASGRAYQDYVTDEILRPLGMNDTVWEYEAVPDGELAYGYRWEDEQWKPEPLLHTGAFASIGGLITTLDDFSKYVAFHLSAWPAREGEDDGPVRRSSVREMHVAARTRLRANERDLFGEPCPSMRGYAYGLNVWTDCRGDVRITHTGGLPGFGTNVWFYPEHGLGLISFANLTYARSSGPMAAAAKALFGSGSFERRAIATSDVLHRRAEEVRDLVLAWNDDLAGRILAENVDLDRSLDRRRREIEAILADVGAIESTDPIVPDNRLRGTFVMHGRRGDVEVRFTLTPESEPRVQWLRVRKL